MIRTNHCLIKSACLLAALLFAAGSGTPARAQDSRDPDRLELYGKARFGYDDNVFYSQDKKHDTFAVYILGLQLEKDFLRNFTFELGGEIRHRDYDTEDSRDNTEYDIETVLETRFAEYAKLRVGGAFYSAIAPVDPSTLLAADQTRNTGTAVLSVFPHDYWGADLGHSIQDMRYRDRRLETLEYRETLTWLQAYYKLTGKTKAGAKVTWGEHEYKVDTQLDSRRKRYSAFLDYKMTGKLSSYLEAGIENVDYDTNNPNAIDRDNADNSLYLEYLLSYDLDAFWKLDAGIKRQTFSSSNVNSNYRTDLTGSLYATYQHSNRLTLVTGGTYTDSDENNTFDSNRWTASVNAAYEVSSSFGIELGYRHENYETKRPDSNYRRNVGFAGIVISY